MGIPLEKNTYRVTLKDKETGKIVSFEEKWTRYNESASSDESFDYYWKEGNMACDCNRAPYFGIDDFPCNFGEDESGEEIQRFVLLNIERVKNRD